MCNHLPTKATVSLCISLAALLTNLFKILDLNHVLLLNLLQVSDIPATWEDIMVGLVSMLSYMLLYKTHIDHIQTEATLHHDGLKPEIRL